MAKLIVHIGHAKTGSTSIQKLLSKNRRALANQGFVYIDSRGSITPSDFGGGNYGIYAQRKDADPNRIRDIVRSKLKPREKLIVSSEGFADGRYLDSIVQAASIVKTRVIFYVRRQDKRLISQWGHWAVRRGQTLQHVVAEASRKNSLDYAAIAQRWVDIAAPGEFYTRFMDPHYLKDGELVADFCAAAGIDVSKMKLPDVRNSSLDYRALDWFRRHPHIFTSADDARFTKLLRGRGGKPKSKKMPRWMFDEIRGRYEDLNKAYAAKYMPQIPYEPILREEGAPICDQSATENIPEQQDFMITSLLELLMAQHTEIASLKCSDSPDSRQ